jgi:hypothetical protein
MRIASRSNPHTHPDVQVPFHHFSHVANPSDWASLQNRPVTIVGTVATPPGTLEWRHTPLIGQAPLNLTLALTVHDLM